MLKKWTAFLVTVVLVAGTIFVSAEDENSTYSALVFIDDPFVSRLMEYEGMTAGQVESFMDDIDDFIASFKENIYESDADTIFITILLQVMQREEHLPVMVAFDAMFPEEIAYMLHLYPRLQPAMAMTFHRISFIGKAAPTLRITFDCNICWRTSSLDLSIPAPGTQLLEKGQQLMELKFSGAIPLWLSHLLNQFSCYPISFSKYGRAYEAMLAQKAGSISERNYI